jgi:hypothetical protein
MTFDYRVCKESVDGCDVFSIREVYYGESKQVMFVTETPMVLGEFEDLEDAKTEMWNVMTAFMRPVVDLNELPFWNTPRSATG